MAEIRTLKVLFVDDDRDESYLFNEALEHSDLPILLTRAHDGLQLLNTLNSGALPDIIMMDVNMPYKDGMEALADIRSNPAFANIRVIIYSISKDKKAIKKAYDMGADLYMIKPADFEGMMEAIRKIYSIDWKHFKRPAREAFLLQVS